MNPHVRHAIRAYHGVEEEIPSDTLGSYTGTSDKGFAPVQDADDL